MKKIGITETALRDANQSLMAARMRLRDFEPILETMDSASYHSIECWGGATFDACLRFLDEDPWARLRAIRARVKNTPLQMLLRGQNLLGYKHYPDDIVRAFVRRAVECGIGIIRVFDALNDLRNIETAVDEGLRAGAHVSGAICFTVSPVHSLDTFMALAKKLEQMGCHSVCIKDMAGIMGPQECFELVHAIKRSVSLPVAVHTHCTAGLGPLTAMKAVEAGADIIDCATASLSGGASQPATETMNYALRQMGFDAGLDTLSLKKINDFFRAAAVKGANAGHLSPSVLDTDPDALTYQIPGGMLSNLISQLSAQNALARLPEVLAEAVRVRKDLGYPPLVTPVSQMVGAQAASNVLNGGRYRNISREICAYVAGEYGKAPGEIDRDLRARVLDGRSGVNVRFADMLEPGFEKARAEIGHIARGIDDVLSYAVFPQVAEQYMLRRERRGKSAVSYTIEQIGGDAK